VIRPPQQNLGRQVPALLPTEGAGDHERLERKLLYPGWDIAPASLALDNEEFPFLDSKSHGRITIGEYMANVYLRKSGSAFGAPIGILVFDTCMYTVHRLAILGQNPHFS
jgi:hypothetical protein